MCYIHYLLIIVSCVRKTNIKLFSRLMRRIQWNHVRRKIFFFCFTNVDVTLKLSGFYVLFLFIGLLKQNNKSDLKLHLYTLY